MHFEDQNTNGNTCTTDTSAGQTHLFIQNKKKYVKFPECQINIRTVY